MVQAPQTQAEPFNAEIEVFNRNEIKEILSGHLQAYYEYHCNRAEDLTKNVLETAQLDADTGSNVFEALFADKEEFRDRKSSRKFLETATCSVDTKVLHKLLAWVKDLVSLHGGEKCTIHRSSDTPEEIGGSLVPFVTKNQFW